MGNKTSQGIGHLLLIFVVFGILAASVYVYSRDHFSKESIEENRISPGPTIKITPQPKSGNTPSPTSFYDFEIDLPEGMVLTPGSGWGQVSLVTVASLDEIRTYYFKYRDGDGCPGVCSSLIKEDVLEEQFTILKNVSTLEKCELTSDIRKQIDRFMLFARGIESKDIIDVVWNNNLKSCGLKFIGPDGYEVSLSNYEYQAGFIREDKLVKIDLPLFPVGIFHEVDSIWSDLGYENGSCNSTCLEKEVKYFENVDYKDSVIEKVIDSYDQTVKSFRFK